MIVSRERVFDYMRDGRSRDLIGHNVVLLNGFISPISSVNWGAGDDVSNIIVLTLKDDLRIFIGEMMTRACLENERIPHDKLNIAHL
jgi:hypothetical protein